MTTDRINPIRDTDDAARTLARGLLDGARTAALAVIDPETGGPYVSRIAFGRAPDGTCLALLSDLALHARAVRADPRASLLIGEPGGKGDPLTQPRLTLRVTAAPVTDPSERARLRPIWLQLQPKSKLYVDFADFCFFRFKISYALLNGGFGKAYALEEKDLTLR
jgi:heme iron utilization protein